jgi:tetratricopeptide (TPR) repeat protein
MQKRWNDLDALMTERVNRRHDNPELLIDIVDVIVRNVDEEYKQRYLQLALTAAQRAVEILGQNEPDAIFALANVYLARGEQEEALNWLAKTVAFAGEDHENIDAYRARLEEASSQMKEPVQQ